MPLEVKQISVIGSFCVFIETSFPLYSETRLNYSNKKYGCNQSYYPNFREKQRTMKNIIFVYGKRFKIFLNISLLIFSLQEINGQNLGTTFQNLGYTIDNLGSLPNNVPTRYGGIEFKYDNSNVLLAGGNANEFNGAIYAVDVVRNANNQIIDFSTASFFANANDNLGTSIDGGLDYGPENVLFYVTYIGNSLGQIKPESTGPDKIINLSLTGWTASSTGALQFVPEGFSGAGRLKISSWSDGVWYDAQVIPDGNGTYDISLESSMNLGQDVEGFIYVKGGNAGFPNDAVLIGSYNTGIIFSYDIDENGNPILATKRVFIENIGNYEGATVDPITGDFFFVDWGGANEVITVRGFEKPELPNDSISSCLDDGEPCFLLGRWEGLFDQYSCSLFEEYPMVVEIETVNQDSFSGRIIWPTLNSETAMNGYLDIDNNKIFFYETSLLGGNEVVLNGVYESTIIDCENLKGFWYVNELQDNCSDPQTLIDGGNYEIQKVRNDCIDCENIETSDTLILADGESFNWEGITIIHDTTLCQSFETISGCDSISCLIIQTEKNTPETTCRTNNRANIWYFGRNAGLDFNTEPPTPLLDGALSIWEGSATICDNEGQLLIYTDGRKIWNKQHQVMPSANNLGGDNSATQSGIIVPQPNSDNILYVFSVDDEGGSGGLQYAVVDMNLDNGLGGLVNANNRLLERSTEKITVIPNKNQNSLWIVAHEFNNANFVIWELDKNGLSNNPRIINIGSIHGPNRVDAIGYMKASPNGNKIALTTGYTKDEVELFDFNNETGVISNPVKISIDELINPYGVEFSPDGNYLYLAGAQNIPFVQIYQLDLTLSTANEVVASAQIIGRGTYSTFGALQTGPDGRIYVTKEGSEYLSVINNPNQTGLASSFEEDAIYLGGRITEFGLPNLIPSFFNEEASIEIIKTPQPCASLTDLQATISSQNDNISYQWYLNDNLLTDSISNNIVVGESGTYSVEIEILLKCTQLTNTYKEKIEVEIEDSITIEKIDITNSNCGGNDGAIIVNTSSNIDGYQYALEGITDFQSNNTFQFLEAGEYVLSVKDKNNCTHKEVLTIVDTSISLAANIETTATTCGNNNGIISIKPLEENSIKNYSIDGINYVNENIFKDLSAGDYTLFVRNRNCIDTLITSINGSEAPQIIDFDITPAACDKNTGIIKIIAEHTTELTYSIDELSYQEDNIFTNLAENEYTISIKDSDNCAISETVQLPSSPPLQIINTQVTLPLCRRPGEISFNVSGSTGAISTILNGQDMGTMTDFQNLNPGIYQIVFTDEFGCSIDTTLSLSTSCPVYVPNTFSPNSNNNNDVFKIFTANNIDATIKIYSIYNRWGNLIYEAKNFPINSLQHWWDGSFDNEKLAVTNVFIYYVEVELEDGTIDILKGDITIYN